MFERFSRFVYNLSFPSQRKSPESSLLEQTEGEIWYQELLISLKDLEEYVHTRIVDRRAPYLGSRKDYVHFDQYLADLKTDLLPLEHRKEEVSRIEWFKRFHAVKVLLELVKLNQPVGSISINR